jgi:outer membrane protein assembly factor BamB
MYCLRSEDGQLVWRLQIAPEDRRIVAFGQLESAWPVHGTVLVREGVAYVAAGRSTHLDGGIKVYAVEPETGRVICPLEPEGQKSHGLEDVLVSDGQAVYMRHLKYGLVNESVGEATTRNGDGRAAKGQGDMQPKSSGPRAFSTAGLLDDTRFSRVGWSAGHKRGNNDLVVFDEHATYAFRSRRKGGFGGWYQAGSDAYELVAYDRELKKHRWSQTMPIRVLAMAVAGDMLFAAGPPDTVDTGQPWAAFEGKQGASLLALSTEDGKRRASYDLKVPPVLDGLAVAAERLYVSAADGRVLCFGKGRAKP